MYVSYSYDFALPFLFTMNELNMTLESRKPIPTVQRHSARGLRFPRIYAWIEQLGEDRLEFQVRRFDMSLQTRGKRHSTRRFLLGQTIHSPLAHYRQARRRQERE